MVELRVEVFRWLMCAACGKLIRASSDFSEVCRTTVNGKKQFAHQPKTIDGLSGLYVNDQHVWVP